MTFSSSSPLLLLLLLLPSALRLRTEHRQCGVRMLRVRARATLIGERGRKETKEPKKKERLSFPPYFFVRLKIWLYYDVQGTNTKKGVYTITATLNPPLDAVPRLF